MVAPGWGKRVEVEEGGEAEIGCGSQGVPHLREHRMQKRRVGANSDEKGAQSRGHTQLTDWQPVFASSFSGVGTVYS